MVKVSVLIVNVHAYPVPTRHVFASSDIQHTRRQPLEMSLISLQVPTCQVLLVAHGFLLNYQHVMRIKAVNIFLAAAKQFEAFCQSNKLALTVAKPTNICTIKHQAQYSERGKRSSAACGAKWIFPPTPLDSVRLTNLIYRATLNILNCTLMPSLSGMFNSTLAFILGRSEKHRRWHVNKF